MQTIAAEASNRESSDSKEFVHAMNGAEDEDRCAIYFQQTEAEKGGKMKEEEKPLTKLEQIEKALAGKRQKQSELKAELATIGERTAKKKQDYETAVKTRVADDALDKMDAEIFKLDRERVRIEIRLNQCSEEIEQLVRDRENAHAEGDRAKYDEDAQAAIAEAKEIDSLAQTLTVRGNANWQRLSRMKKYCEAAGIAERSYKLRNLTDRTDRVSAILRNGIVTKSHEQSYEEIIKGNVAAVEQQLNRSAPASEAVTAIAEPAAELAN